MAHVMGHLGFKDEAIGISGEPFWSEPPGKWVRMAHVVRHSGLNDETIGTSDVPFRSLVLSLPHHYLGETGNHPLTSEVSKGWFLLWVCGSSSGLRVQARPGT